MLGMAMSDEKYYTVEQVAEMYQVTRQAVYNWIAQKRLKAVKIGSATRIKQSAIDAFEQPFGLKRDEHNKS